MPRDTRPSKHSGQQLTTPTDSPFLSQMRSLFGTEMVTVIRNPGTEDEESFQVEAHIQGRTGSFDVGTPIFTGDYVELPDPRLGTGGVERRYVATAKVLRTGPAHTNRVKVEWGDAPAPPRVAAVRRLTFENLHPAVQEAAGSFFADGQHEAAVSEAFKSIDDRVRTSPASTGQQSTGWPRHSSRTARSWTFLSTRARVARTSRKASCTCSVAR